MAVSRRAFARYASLLEDNSPRGMFMIGAVNAERKATRPGWSRMLPNGLSFGANEHGPTIRARPTMAGPFKGEVVLAHSGGDVLLTHDNIVLHRGIEALQWFEDGLKAAQGTLDALGLEILLTDDEAA